LSAPPVDDATLLEGQLLGHPNLMNKFINPLKSDDLGAQLKVEKATNVILDDSSSFDIVELAPEIF
jgi:hypothetical protein